MVRFLLLRLQPYHHQYIYKDFEITIIMMMMILQFADIILGRFIKTNIKGSTED